MDEKLVEKCLLDRTRQFQILQSYPEEELLRIQLKEAIPLIAEEIFKEVESVGQDIDEDGKGTDDKARVVDTIYYIGKGRLEQLKERYGVK